MPQEIKAQKPKWFALLGYAAVLVLCFLYILLVLKPHLLYHMLGTTSAYPVNINDTLTIGRILSLPGGAVNFASGYLLQWFCYHLAGTVTILAIALAAAFGCRSLTAGNGSLYTDILSMAAAAGVLTIFSSYENILVMPVALAISLWTAVFFIKISHLSYLVRAVSFIVIFSVLYYAAGAASLLFTVIVCIYELSMLKKWRLVPAYLAVTAAVVWLLGVFLSDLSLADAFTVLLPFKAKLNSATGGIVWQILDLYVLLLYLYVLLLIAVVFLIKGFCQDKKSLPKAKKQARSDNSASKLRPILYSAFALLVFVLCAAAIYMSFDPVKKKHIELDYFAGQKDWEKVLQKASQIPISRYNLNCIFEINRALYHTGQLSEKMFSYPQRDSSLLFSLDSTKTNSVQYLKRMQLYLELGDVNIAERYAYEILEQTGNKPDILKVLAKINLVKNQPYTANVFLNKLLSLPIYNKTKTADEKEIISEDQIQRLRSVAVTEDTIYSTMNLEDYFKRLLARNKYNRMAFEYMMASFLLSGQTANIASNISMLEDFGYEKLPRHFEEALVIYMGPEGKKQDFDRRWIPDKEALNKALKFNKILTSFGNNKPAAMQALKSEFGDSYYFYYIFILQGQKK